METNTAFTFAYLLMALFNKQIPIAMVMINRKVKQMGSSRVFSPPEKLVSVRLSKSSHV